MKKIAIIGASYLQLPLIMKAKEMGLETHVFAWQVGDVGEKEADFFYPISIIEKEKILEECRKIGIDGICSIASDLAVVTVNYVAQKMHLIGNTQECTLLSTNKNRMRKAFEMNGDPSPKSVLVTDYSDLENELFNYPIIVKPTDRSGSRGITKLENKDGLKQGIDFAIEQGFEKKALVEEFVSGREFSVEFISYNGEHYFLGLTQKYTTGAPHFIEKGHMEPAMVSVNELQEIKKIVMHALDSLRIKYGASHTELKITETGKIFLIEIGSRMGGDFIGSDLVYLSSGVDFVKAVIQIALGEKPTIENERKNKAAAVRFIFDEEDVKMLNKIKKEHPEYIVYESVQKIDSEVTDSSSRHGAYIMQADSVNLLTKYMPDLHKE